MGCNRATASDLCADTSLLSPSPEPKHLGQICAALIDAPGTGTIRMYQDGNPEAGFGGWGWDGSWESAAAESKPQRGHFQSECQSCHLLLLLLPSPQPRPCCLRTPAGSGSPCPASQSGRKDGKLHTSVSGRLPGHLRSILPRHPRAFSPTSRSSLRCHHKGISGSKEVNAGGRRRRGRGKRFP